MTRKCLKCNKQSNFNFKGLSFGIYCADHKEEGMINIYKRTCLCCSRTAYFNLPGEKLGLYCSTHRKYGMIDVSKRRCFLCDKRPNYNFIGAKVGILCASHKDYGMVNVRKVSQWEKCINKNVFNEEKNEISKISHLTEISDTIDKKNNRCIRCSKLAYFNFADIPIAIYCNTHREEGMVNVNNDNNDIDKYFNRYLHFDDSIYSELDRLYPLELETL